jgi:hypothetical protein
LAYFARTFADAGLDRPGEARHSQENAHSINLPSAPIIAVGFCLRTCLEDQVERSLRRTAKLFEASRHHDLADAFLTRLRS